MYFLSNSSLLDITIISSTCTPQYYIQIAVFSFVEQIESSLHCTNPFLSNTFVKYLFQHHLACFKPYMLFCSLHTQSSSISYFLDISIYISPTKLLCKKTIFTSYSFIFLPFFVAILNNILIVSNRITSENVSK